MVSALSLRVIARPQLRQNGPSILRNIMTMIIPRWARAVARIAGQPWQNRHTGAPGWWPGIAVGTGACPADGAAVPGADITAPAGVPTNIAPGAGATAWAYGRPGAWTA